MEAGIDAQAFRHGMRRLAAGVTVVTTIEGGVRHGIVVTSASSVSAEPRPSLLVCVNQTASCHDVLLRTGFFCASVLSADDVAIAQRFASPADRHLRFEQGAWTTLATGAPAVSTALASFDCEVLQAIPVHTHTILVGEVRAMRIWKDDIDPLLYVAGRYEHFDHSARTTR